MLASKNGDAHTFLVIRSSSRSVTIGKRVHSSLCNRCGNCAAGRGDPFGMPTRKRHSEPWRGLRPQPKAVSIVSPDRS